MPHPRTRVLRGRSASREPERFDDLLYEQLGKAPWILASLAAHGALAVVLLLLPSSEPAAERPLVRMTAEMDADEPPPLEEPPDPLQPEEVPDELPERPDEVPAPPDPIERPRPGPKGPVVGPTPFPKAMPFPATGTNHLIGIGGNAGGGDGGPFGGRMGGGGGGGRPGGTDGPVMLALEWLKNHQSPDGRWKCDGFDERCKLNRCSGAGEAAYTPGVSGLALLAFLGHGETHRGSKYADTVGRGLKYLRDVQDAEGCFGPRASQHFQYNHACAALAMSEAYGLTQSRLFRSSAQRGVDFVIASQNPYLAWRYGVRDGDNDTSVTGWMTMVLKSSKMAGLDVDTTAFRGAVAWLDRMTEPEFGRTGYQQRGGQPARTAAMMDRFPPEKSESLTAVAVLTRIFAGQNPEKHEAIRKGAALMAKKPPVWDIDSGDIDMYYWYYGTLAMFQVGGPGWKTWNAHMKSAVIGSQRTEAGRDEKGSWDPEGPWGPEGGRVYSTAVMAMCLEVYYRYGPVFGSR